jgi:hypothetical protein
MKLDMPNINFLRSELGNWIVVRIISRISIAFCILTALLHSGNKFLCWLAVLAFAGATRTTALVHYLWYILLDGSGFCEEECHGNQRKITPRN